MVEFMTTDEVHISIAYAMKILHDIHALGFMVRYILPVF